MDTYSEQALQRTHSCGQLRLTDVDRPVRLCGWVRSYRDHGGVLFVDLRDRDGITQVVFDPDTIGADAYEIADSLRNEWVISIAGKVGPRGEDRVNPKLPTGEIEVNATELVVLNRSETVPFEPDNFSHTHEDTRLRYRFIDLRRPELNHALRTRALICQKMRKVLEERDFVEVETPFLTKSTPEGARDFLVPSRSEAGAFYALPQSPQLFKQLLMVGGLERYYQIARCFRDEDLRADRQPEFTQLDLEMSFCTQQDVMDVTNAVLRDVCAACDRPFPGQVPVMTYAEAMRRFGSDRPDLRFGMELHDIGDLAGKTSFGVFQGALGAGGTVQCVCVPGAADMARRETDALAEWSKEFGAKGMAVTKVGADGALETGIAKFLADVSEELIARVSAKPGDLLCFGADTEKVVLRVLGELRCKMARERGMINENDFQWVWIVDFPLFEHNPEEPSRWNPLHHPFTMPRLVDVEKLESDTASVLSDAYDIVCNGVEMGGGSIRIHSMQLQERIFRLLNIGEDEARAKFGFLLDALQYGAPPHGGLALGLDRVAMIMLGASSLRDVIAFPKTKTGHCPLTDAPACVDDKQLQELSIRVATPPKTKAKE